MTEYFSFRDPFLFGFGDKDFWNVIHGHSCAS